MKKLLPALTIIALLSTSSFVFAQDEAKTEAQDVAQSSALETGQAFEQDPKVIARTADELERIEKILAAPTDFTKPEQFENLPLGAATNTHVFNRDLFSQPSENMTFAQELDFKVGNGFFRKLWVAAPTSTKLSDGLGPTFNARACQNCHFKDGRGRPSLDGDLDASLFLRLGMIKGERPEKSANIPDPIYGGQLQDRSNLGIPAEGKVTIEFEIIKVQMAAGDVIELQKPIYGIKDLGYGPLSPDTGFSPRLAPPMIGLGFVEAVSEEDILAHEDIEDKDGDGISGRANRVWSNALGRFALGRFGHQAGNATIKDQTAGAFSGDMGLSTSLFPNPSGECTKDEALCLNAPDGKGEDGYEVSNEVLNLVNFYGQNLAVPERKNFDNPEVLQGKQIFYEIGCKSCHIPKFVTQRFEGERPQSFQLIWPYSDFLLHDMGEGLADPLGDWEADSGEWRTAPLWGIGHTELVSGQASYLHDGRARTLLEAILWHGGEASASRDAVVSLPLEDRSALIKFLESM